MKKQKKLSLNRETLRVESFMRQVVGGFQTAQVNCDDQTDIGPDSQCNLCGTGICGCAGPDWCHSVNGCVTQQNSCQGTCTPTCQQPC